MANEELIYRITRAVYGRLGAGTGPQGHTFNLTTRIDERSQDAHASLDRFENNSGGAKSCIGLNGAQKLRALRDGVAIGIDDFEFGAKILGGDTRGCGLLELKIVGLRDK